jgi:hypothetical protein
LTVFLEAVALGAAAVSAFAAGAASFLAFFTGTYTEECNINQCFLIIGYERTETHLRSSLRFLGSL